MIALALALSIGCFEEGGVLARSWPIFPFVPVCWHLEGDDPKMLLESPYTYVSGELTDEAWNAAAAAFDVWSEQYQNERHGLSVRNGALYYSTEGFVKNLIDYGYNRDLESDSGFFLIISLEISGRIYEKSQIEGRNFSSNSNNISTGRVPRKGNADAKVMRHYECGFMEELIMKGGRFASE